MPTLSQSYSLLINPSQTGDNTITAGGAAIVPLTLKGAVGQTADVLQVKNSSNSNLFNVTSAGAGSIASNFTVSGNTLNIGTGGAFPGILNFDGVSVLGIFLGSTGNPLGAFDGGGSIKAFKLISTSSLSWSSATTLPAAGSNGDTNLSRISAGLLGVGTGAQGSVAGSISCTNLTLSALTNNTNVVNAVKFALAQSILQGII